jgi:hypothetical protein
MSNKSSTIVCFKWKKNKQGYKLKNQLDYGNEHVNILYRSIQRNSTHNIKFICITDDISGIDKNIITIPLWDKCRNLGGCYNRLFVFDRSMQTLLGDRFTCIDLDCVIVGNIDNILDRTEEFIINQYQTKGTQKQKYNGGLFTMDAGSRKQVWEKFDMINSHNMLQKLRDNGDLLGSDQAWIQYILGENEKKFTNADGVYDYAFLENGALPDNANIVFFPGRVDPFFEKDKISWIKEHWRV